MRDVRLSIGLIMIEAPNQTPLLERGQNGPSNARGQTFKGPFSITSRAIAVYEIPDETVQLPEHKIAVC